MGGRIIATLFAGLASSVFFVTFAASADIASADPGASDHRAEWLLQGLKRVADEGQLFDPNLVARSLHVTLSRENQVSTRIFGLHFRIVEGNSFETSCEEGRSAGLEQTSELRPAEDDWLSQVRQVEGKPHLTYNIFNIKYCNINYLSDDVSAQLDINIEHFDPCITIGDIKSVINVKQRVFHIGQSDGPPVPFYYDYSGRVDEFSGTRIEFAFDSNGNKCMTGARVIQNKKDGLRYIHAFARYRACADKMDHLFCQQHAPFSFAEGGVMDEMDAFAAEKCGSLNSYYDREPQVSQTPPPLASRNRYRKSPCDLD